MRYPSGKSIWFGMLLWVVILLLVISFIIVPYQNKGVFLLGSVTGIFLPLWIWFGTYYEFKSEYLLIRLGPFFQRIPYDKITAAKKFSGIASSMALSGAMIELRHGKNYLTGTTYISPKDRDGFLAELKKHVAVG